MFAGFEQRKMILALVLLISLAAGSLFAATVDPLLQGLVRDKAVDITPILVYQNFLAIDSRVSSADPTVGVILHKESGWVDLSGVPDLVVGSRSDRFVTARLPLSSLPWLEANEDISHVEAARLMLPLMDAARADGNVEEVWNGAPAFTGDGVLVGVIDSGIDWSHADFDDASGDTRIQYIWDLYTSNGTPPTGFDFGTEYNASQINAGTCTEVDISGHGTHVSGIAAGNGFESGGVYSGVAPEANIIFAKAYDDNQHGFPGDMVVNAMNYLAGKAAGQPMTINMSLGGHMGPHDGTSAQEQLIDDLSGIGIVFCVAAGNEGEMSLHDSGPASGANLPLSIGTVPGSNNDYVLLNIWVDGTSSPSVSLTYGATTLGPVASGSQDGFAGSYGTVVIDNATGSNTNGDKQMIIQLDDQNGSAPGIGNWTVNISGGSGTAHAWVAVSNMDATFTNSDQSYSVGMPGTSEAAISVAAHKTKGEWTSFHGDVGYGEDWAAIANGDHAPFSSIGPTRDGREKPDLSAPGMGIFAPYSSDTSPYPGDPWVDPGVNYLLSQGTSMATPFVCGVAALMLEKNSTLTAAQIKTILRESAAVDGFTGDVWNNYFGAGKVDAMAAVQAVSDLGPPPTGDVNADEATTVLDLVLLANHIADPSGNPLDSDARQQGDVYPSPSGDGVLNASDLARIVSFILESDEPGFAPPVMESVNFELAQAIWRDGRWWQCISINGDGIAAGQFALNLDGAVWNPQDLECESGVQVTAGVAGSQLRVLLYDLGGDFPAGGVTVQVPFDFAADEPGIARTAGVLMVDRTGEPLEIRETSFQPTGFLRVSPNPAPGDMVVSFARQNGRYYELSVFDLRGRRVRGIGRGGGNDSQGNGSVIFDGRDDAGRLLPTGIYFVRLNSEGHTFSTKVMLTR